MAVYDRGHAQSQTAPIIDYPLPHCCHHCERSRRTQRCNPRRRRGTVPSRGRHRGGTATADTVLLPHLRGC